VQLRDGGGHDLKVRSWAYHIQIKLAPPLLLLASLLTSRKSVELIARSAFVLFERRAIELNCCTKRDATHGVRRTLDAEDWVWILPFELSLRCVHRRGLRYRHERPTKIGRALRKS
jgi:hypothetical protein